MPPKERKFTSQTWQFFTRKGGFTASCNLCGCIYSYRTTVSNLKKHLVTKHIEHLWEDDNGDEGHSSGDEHESLPHDLSPRFCKYFKPTPKSDVAHCRLCDEDVVGGAEELTQHVTDHHQREIDSDEEESGTRGLWAYFTRQPDSVNAICVLCSTTVNYRAGIQRLTRHLKARHPKVKLDDDEDLKTLIISANGQLYEVENDEDNNENEVDPMDTVYLDEYVDLPKKRKTGERPPLIHKRRESVTIDRLKKNRVEQRETVIFNTRSNQGDRDSTERDCLTYFNKYLMSLMRDLPNRTSGKLQADILKLVLDAKIAHDAQKEIDYNITVLNNHANEPVAVAVSETKVSLDNVDCNVSKLDS